MRRNLLALFILWSLCFAVFSPSLTGDFLRDDEADIVKNPALGSAKRWYDILTDPASQSSEPSIAGRKYRPLTTVSLALSQSLGGYNPYWFHILDISIHGLNTCLVFVLMLHLLGGSARSKAAPAWAAALLFALHPVQVESVSYISAARPNGLSLFLCLLAFQLYRSRDRVRLFSPWAVGAWGLFLLALGAKEGALFLPLALAAHDLVFEEDRWTARLRSWTPFAAVAAGFLLLRHGLLGQTAHKGLWGGSLGAHIGYAAHGLFQDIRLALWPSGLRTCYSFSDGPGFGLETVLILLVLAALIWAGLDGLRHKRPEGFALCWSLAALVPVSNIVPIAVLAADRFLHAPLVGLALLGGFLSSRLDEKRAAFAAAALALLLLPLTLGGQLKWQSQLALVLNSRAAAEEDPCPALILADQYLDWGMPEKARQLAEPAKDHRLLGKKARRILRRAGTPE